MLLCTKYITKTQHKNSIIQSNSIGMHFIVTRILQALQKSYDISKQNKEKMYQSLQNKNNREFLVHIVTSILKNAGDIYGFPKILASIVVLIDSARKLYFCDISYENSSFERKTQYFRKWVILER